MIEFTSFLAKDLEAYLQFRIDQGFRYRKSRWFFATLDRFINETNARPEDLTPIFFLDFRTTIDADPGTINKIFLHLGNFFAYLIRMEKITENPLADIPGLSENHFIPFVFSPEQIEELLTAFRKQIRTSRKCFFLRDLAVNTAMNLMARCGMRISEPFRLKDEDWRRDEKTLYIEKTKFNKDRLIPVPEKVVSEIDNFLSARTAVIGELTGADLLTVRPGVAASKFVLYKYFHRAVKAVGIERPRRIIGNITFGGPTPHSLRHSFAVNTLKSVRERGGSAENALPVLAAFLGHADWRYTIKYLKVIDAEYGEALVNFCIKHKREDPV